MRENMLQCPVCGAFLEKKERALVCTEGHSFDIARQGYVNLLPVTQKHSKHPGDTRDMVAARRRFWIRAIMRPLLGRCGRCLAHGSRRSVCAGCRMRRGLLYDPADGAFSGRMLYWRGYFQGCGALCRRTLQKRIVADGFCGTSAMASGSMDGVMSMFALTVPEEFSRVLKPGGWFLEVTAGRDHLMALKTLIYPEIIQKQERISGTTPDLCCGRKKRWN